MKMLVNKLLRTCFVILLISTGQAYGQWVYGSSYLGYDEVSGEVFSYSRTWVDVYVGIDHDPEVDGYLYQINSLVDSGTDSGWMSHVPATVDLEAPAIPSTQYTILMTIGLDV